MRVLPIDQILIRSQSLQLKSILSQYLIIFSIYFKSLIVFAKKIVDFFDWSHLSPPQS